jgi:hypothetical protein
LNWGGGENNAGLCELEANKKRQRIDTAEEIDFIDGIIDAIAAGEEPCTLGLMFQYTEDLFGEGQCYPYDAVTEF